MGIMNVCPNCGEQVINHLSNIRHEKTDSICDKCREEIIWLEKQAEIKRLEEERTETKYQLDTTSAKWRTAMELSLFCFWLALMIGLTTPNLHSFEIINFGFFSIVTWAIVRGTVAWIFRK